MEKQEISQTDYAPSRRESKKYLKSVDSLFRRARKKLNPNESESIQAAMNKLQEDLLKPQNDYIQGYHELKIRADKHLAFAKKSPTREIIESLAFALLVALFIRGFIIEPFKIPTRSMVPTLLDGDQLFVTKLSYGIRIPFVGKQFVKFSQPKKGDVIVFVFPRKEAAQHLMSTNSKCMQLESLAEEKDYIKRVVGVEGDNIEVIDQILHINGEPIEKTTLYQREVSDYFFLSDRRAESWNQEKLGSTQYVTITHELPLNHFGPIKVKPGHLFVMGDNRDNSADSRCWGQVPLDNVKGKAQFIWWSTGSFGIRQERMFTRIR